MREKTRSQRMTNLLAAALSLLAAWPCSADPPNPTPTDLGVLSWDRYSGAFAINAADQVMGNSYD